MAIGNRLVFLLHVLGFPRTTRFDFQHTNVFMSQGLSPFRQRRSIHAQYHEHFFRSNLVGVVDQDDQVFLRLYDQVFLRL